MTLNMHNNNKILIKIFKKNYSVLFCLQTTNRCTTNTQWKEIRQLKPTLLRLEPASSNLRLTNTELHSRGYGIESCYGSLFPSISRTSLKGYPLFKIGVKRPPAAPFTETHTTQCGSEKMSISGNTPSGVENQQ